MKFSFFEKNIFRKYTTIVALVASIVTFILSFLSFIEIDSFIIILILIIFLFVLVLTYPILLIFSKRFQKISLIINQSDVEVSFGDIDFSSNGIIVINFNEYFDTLVDEKIISSKTLNGKFITSHINNLKDFDEYIEESIPESFIIEKNITRKNGGKTTKYQLGTMCYYKNYALLAFSHFDCDNEANLTQMDYVICLLNMWKNLNIHYAQKEIFVPLMGLGITRFKDIKIQPQELLRMLIWTFKISQKKFAEPSKVHILINNKLKNQINLSELKVFEDN